MARTCGMYGRRSIERSSVRMNTMFAFGGVASAVRAREAAARSGGLTLASARWLGPLAAPHRAVDATSATNGNAQRLLSNLFIACKNAPRLCGAERGIVSDERGRPARSRSRGLSAGETFLPGYLVTSTLPAA